MSHDILIVCYSYSGQTWQAAREIQKICGGTLCSIFPSQPYPRENREEFWKRIDREYHTKNLTGILPITCDPGRYSVLFLGAPVWKGQVPATDLAEIMRTVESGEYTG